MIFSKLRHVIGLLGDKFDSYEFVRYAYSGSLRCKGDDRFFNFLKAAFKLNPTSLYYYPSERAALFDYLRANKKKGRNVALLQRGTCAAVPSALEKAGWEYEFFGERNLPTKAAVVTRAVAEATESPSLVIIQAQFGMAMDEDFSAVAAPEGVRLVLDSALTCITEYRAPFLAQFDAIFLSFDSTKPIPLGYGGVMVTFKNKINTSLPRGSLLILYLYVFAYNLQAFLGRARFLSPKTRVILAEAFSILKSKLCPHFLRNDFPGSPVPSHYFCRFPPAFGNIVFNAHVTYLKEKPIRISRKFKFLSSMSNLNLKISRDFLNNPEWDPLRYPVLICSENWEEIPVKVREKSWFNSDVIGHDEKKDFKNLVLNIPVCDHEKQEEFVVNFVDKYLVRGQK